MTSDEIVLDRLATLVHAFYDHERRDAARHVYRDVKSIIEAQTREIEKLREAMKTVYDLAGWHSDDEADPADSSPEDNIAHVNGLIRQTIDAAKGETVMQKFHELTPQGQLQEEIQTLKSQNERLVKLLDRCVHAVEQEYGIDNWRVEEAKALLAEIKPATASGASS